jgi:hypothetical protein
MTTFGLLIMSNSMCKLLLLTWGITMFVSTKLFANNKRIKLQNIFIYGSWLLQFVTILVFINEFDSYHPASYSLPYLLPFGYFILWAAIITAVVVMIVYATDEWLHDKSKKHISIIQMSISASVGILILLLCSGFFATDNNSKESLFLSLIITIIEWVLFAITLYFKMRNSIIQKMNNKRYQDMLGFYVHTDIETIRKTLEYIEANNIDTSPGSAQRAYEDLSRIVS